MLYNLKTYKWRYCDIIQKCNIFSIQILISILNSKIGLGCVSMLRQRDAWNLFCHTFRTIHIISEQCMAWTIFRYASWRCEYNKIYLVCIWPIYEIENVFSSFYTSRETWSCSSSCSFCSISTCAWEFWLILNSVSGVNEADLGKAKVELDSPSEISGWEELLQKDFLDVVGVPSFTIICGGETYGRNILQKSLVVIYFTSVLVYRGCQIQA